MDIQSTSPNIKQPSNIQEVMTKISAAISPKRAREILREIESKGDTQAVWEKTFHTQIRSQYENTLWNRIKSIFSKNQAQHTISKDDLRTALGKTEGGHSAKTFANSHVAEFRKAVLSKAIRVTSEGSKGTTIKNEDRIRFIKNTEELKSSIFKLFRNLYIHSNLSAVDSDRVRNLRIHLALLIEKKYKNTLDLKGEWHTGGAYMDIRDLFAAKLQLIQDESTLKSIQNKLDNFKNIINTLSTPEQNETPEITQKRNELIANTTTAFLINLLESLSKKDIPSAPIPAIKLISSPL